MNKTIPMTLASYATLTFIALLLAACQSTDTYPSAYTHLKKLEGLHERHNTVQLRKTLGVNPRHTPWCGYALAWAIRKDGTAPPKGYPAAINWRHYGRAVRPGKAVKGDIVVLRRGGHKYHVRLYHGRAPKTGRILVLGGNQSNQVKISSYPASRVLHVRRK